MASGLEVPGHLYGGEEEEDEEKKEGSDRQDAVGRTRPSPRGGSEQTSSTSDTFASNASGLSLGETIARSACQRSDVWFPLEMEADTSNGEEKTIAERDSFLTSGQAVAMSQGSWPAHPVSSAQLEEQDSLLSPVLPLLVTALDGDGAVGSALVQRSVQQRHSELEFTCLRESIASTDFTFEGYSTNREVEKMSLSDSSSVEAVKELRFPESARLTTSQHPSAVSQCRPSAHELQASWSAYGEADSSVFCSLTQHAISPGTDSTEWSPRGHLSEHTKLPGSCSSMHAELSLSQHPIAGASFDGRQPEEDTERLPGLPEEPSQESEWREEESPSSSRGIAGPSRAPMDDKPSSSAHEESRGGVQNEAGMQRERYLQATRFAYLGQEEPPADDALLAPSCVGAELSKAGVDDTGCRFASTQVGSTSEAGSLTRNVIGGNADNDTDSPSLIGTMDPELLTEEDKRQISAIKHLVLRGASVPMQGYVPEGNSESFPQVNSSDCDTNRHWGQIYDRSLRYKTMALAASFSRTTCVTDSWLEGSLLIASSDPNESHREERSERSVPSGAEPDDANIDGADAGAVEASGNNRSSPLARGSFSLALSTVGAFSLGQLGDISAEQDVDALVSARSCGPSQTGNQTPALSTARSQASLEVYLRNLGIEQPPSMTGMPDGRGPLCERDYSPSELTTVKDFGLSSASDGVASNGADGSLGRGSGYSLRSELGQSTSLVLDSDSSLRLSSSLTRSQARATNEDSEAAPGESPEGSGKSRSYLLLLDDVAKGHSQQEVKQSVRVRAPACSEREADTVLSMEDLDNRRGDLSSTPSRLQDRVCEFGSIGLAGYSGPAKSSEFEKPSYRAHAGYFSEDKGSDAQGETWPGSQSTEPAESQVSDSMIGTKTVLGIQKLLRDAGTYDHSTFDASCASNEQDILKSLRTDGRTGPSNSHELQPEVDRAVILDGKAEFDKTSTFRGKIPPTEQHYQSSFFPIGQDDHGSVEHPRPGVAKGAAKARDVSSPFVQPKLDLHSAGKSEQDVERQTIPGSARHEPEGCSGATTGITPRPQRAPSNPSHDDKSSSSGRSSRADVEPQARPLQSGTDAPRSGYGNEGGDDDDVMARVRAILRGATEHAGPQEDSDGSVDAGTTERRRQGAGGLPRSASPSVGTAPPPSQFHEHTGLPSRQGRATVGDMSVGFGQPLPPPPSQIHADIAPGRLRSEADAVSMESVVQRLAVLLSDNSPENLSEGIYRRADEEEQRARELPTKLKLERDGADPAWRSSRGEPTSMQRGDLRSPFTTGHGQHEQSETDSESESVTLTRVSHILSEASGSQRLASLDLSVIEPEPLNVLQRARLRIASQLQRLSDEPFDSSVGLARVAPGQQQQQQPTLPDPPRQPVPGEQLPSQQWSQSRVSDHTGVRGGISGEQPLLEEQSEKSAAGRRADQSRRGSCRLPDRLPEDRSRASERSVGLTDGERSASYEDWVTDRCFRAATLGSVPRPSPWNQ
ncbi:serine-rich adhesin for platelets-like isoform X2 [Lethenteron reissneri]|uniref:serine-rich adhesin for platelets-like isoform X2 n=1 Tax=Lethenteron reissneri TaxID=7753 RepID=UPI002AB6A8B0|nr:serine-rich adhesin for platelets-like isoform X2 [Lethenteron reissneri]